MGPFLDEETTRARSYAHWPHEPCALAFVQVLAAREDTPRTGVARRYRSRLQNLIDGLESECRRGQARFISLVADAGLETLARERLTTLGLLAPR